MWWNVAAQSIVRVRLSIDSRMVSIFIYPLKNNLIIALFQGRDISIQLTFLLGLFDKFIVGCTLWAWTCTELAGRHLVGCCLDQFSVWLDVGELLVGRLKLYKFLDQFWVWLDVGELLVGRLKLWAHIVILCLQHFTQNSNLFKESESNRRRCSDLMTVMFMTIFEFWRLRKFSREVLKLKQNNEDLEQKSTVKGSVKFSHILW